LLKNDVIDDGKDLNNLSCVKFGFSKDSFLVVLLKKKTLKGLKTFGSPGFLFTFVLKTLITWLLAAIMSSHNGGEQSSINLLVTMLISLFPVNNS